MAGVCWQASSGGGAGAVTQAPRWPEATEGVQQEVPGLQDGSRWHCRKAEASGTGWACPGVGWQERKAVVAEGSEKAQEKVEGCRNVKWQRKA